MTNLESFKRMKQLNVVELKKSHVLSFKLHEGGVDNINIWMDLYVNMDRPVRLFYRTEKLKKIKIKKSET